MPISRTGMDMETDTFTNMDIVMGTDTNTDMDTDTDMDRSRTWTHILTVMQISSSFLAVGQSLKLYFCQLLTC
jgi:hypothetical protein